MSSRQVALEKAILIGAACVENIKRDRTKKVAAFIRMHGMVRLRPGFQMHQRLLLMTVDMPDSDCCARNNSIDSHQDNSIRMRLHASIPFHNMRF